MAKQTLPINFVDDILAQPMGGKRKFAITDNGDGTYSIEDVTEYTQIGSDFGASQMNQTNKAINNIYDERVLDLDELELVTEPGFFVDALAVKELNDKLDEKIIVQRYSNRINVSNGQNSYTAINVNIPDGYTIIGISAYAEHATTLCGGGAYDSNNNRIVIPFSAHDSNTPETFYVDLTLMVE